jgi:hypothetical protein
MPFCQVQIPVPIDWNAHSILYFSVLTMANHRHDDGMRDQQKQKKADASGMDPKQIRIGDIHAALPDLIMLSAKTKRIRAF